MRIILLALAAVAAIGVLGMSHVSAAPIGGAVINSAAEAGRLSQPVHCRWYPHRHRANNPHGWGKGCAAPAPKK